MSPVPASLLLLGCYLHCTHPQWHSVIWVQWESVTTTNHPSRLPFFWHLGLVTLIIFPNKIAITKVYCTYDPMSQTWPWVSLLPIVRSSGNGAFVLQWVTPTIPSFLCLLHSFKYFRVCILYCLNYAMGTPLSFYNFMGECMGPPSIHDFIHESWRRAWA